MLRSSLLALVPLVGLSLVARPALAADAIPLASQRVVVADLDLATDAGVAALDERLARAAAKACEKPGLVTGWDRVLVANCRARALAAAADERGRRIAAARGTDQLAAATADDRRN
ncbi:MAG: UrcA family protein [Sphingomonadaceae bacterium]